MPDALKQDGEWTVFDLNAREPDPENRGKFKARIHEARMGVPYALYADLPCYMPESDARVFLRDAAFKVLDAQDRHVPALTEAQLSRAPMQDLPPDMVYANLAELTDEALLTRVALLPGGYKYTSAAPRDVLIEALYTGPTPEEAPSDLGEDGLDPRATQKMLEGV